MNRTPEDVLRELEREEARLAEVERQREQLHARIAALRSELRTASRVPNGSSRSPALSLGVEEGIDGLVSTGGTPRSSAEKIALFRSLFRGRPDVFPSRFVSKRTGMAGYAPECFNKWKPGLCELKSGGRCGDCANQAFVPVGDDVVEGHLRGRHVMGVYPLLPDESCWFLAADFDQSSWQRDVAAFAETCGSAGVPVAVERSRSGAGAHAWIFFSAPVQANVARRMGCYLLTETTSRRHELTLDSYDRLFPNQDTMPRGGFGNLIALPLQYQPRQLGNSVFVDDRFEAYDDQWAFLASLPRMEPKAVEAMAAEATHLGQVVGVRLGGADDGEDESSAPWRLTPSGETRAPRILGPLPAEVKAVWAQRLFIEKKELPSPLLNQLKRIAAFQNPEFYKKQKLRLSTALTPRVIACAADVGAYVALPRGCVVEARQLLEEHGIELVVEDRRQEGESVSLSFNGELTPIQQQAARLLLAHDSGVFVGPPGIGKTVLGTYLVAQRARSTLVLVHRKPLLEQWIAQLAMFLGIPEKQIGRIGGGHRKPTGRLDVAMIQSLIRRDSVDDLVAEYGHVIVDECHHLPAVSFERVLSEVKARYVLGLTATPQRRDGHQPITEMQLGPVRFEANDKSQAARRPFAHKLVVRDTGFRMTGGTSKFGIQSIYRELARDEDRNQKIVDDVVAAAQEGRSPIVLTERKDHLELLATRLRPRVRHLVLLHGSMTAKDKRESLEHLSSIPESAERAVLAIGRYIGEGFDDARLDSLFLAMPISWKGTLIQYSGRLHRRHAGKKEVRIYDYVDRDVPVLLRMFEKRLSTYKAMGYARDETLVGFVGQREARSVEDNLETRRLF